MSRQERVAEALKQEVSRIIHDELKDPRLGFITIISVELTKDLRFARVFFSILGNEKQEKDTLAALESGAGFIRKLIGDRIKLRFTPEIVFKLDKSAEYSVKIFEELERLKNERKKSRKGSKK